MSTANLLSGKADRFVFGVPTNNAESNMNLVARFAGGKLITYRSRIRTNIGVKAQLFCICWVLITFRNIEGHYESVLGRR